MRAAPLGLAFLLAFSVPILATPEAEAGFQECVFVSSDPGAWVCVTEWDEPHMWCVEYRIGGRQEERCRDSPAVPSAAGLPVDPSACPIERDVATVCVWTYGGPDEGCLEAWILGSFRSTCWTLPGP
jgi:hypothetical protein